MSPSCSERWTVLFGMTSTQRCSQIIPGPKSAWGKGGPAESSSQADLPEARFWTASDWSQSLTRCVNNNKHVAREESQRLSAANFPQADFWPASGGDISFCYASGSRCKPSAVSCPRKSTRDYRSLSRRHNASEIRSLDLFIRDSLRFVPRERREERSWAQRISYNEVLPRMILLADHPEPVPPVRRAVQFRQAEDERLRAA
jgi:hypothetical protein